MRKFLDAYTEHAYALMRFVMGLLLSCHGAQKLFGLFGGLHGTPGFHAVLLSTAGVAGLIEACCGLLVAVGLLASYAAFLSSGLMAVAYFTVHAPQGVWPIQNGGELAVAYCFALLLIATRGDGRFSVGYLRCAGSSGA